MQSAGPNQYFLNVFGMGGLVVQVYGGRAVSWGGDSTRGRGEGPAWWGPRQRTGGAVSLPREEAPTGIGACVFVASQTQTRRNGTGAWEGIKAPVTCVRYASVSGHRQRLCHSRGHRVVMCGATVHAPPAL
jgi:hypothetical protein